jgi:hypothetical protein
MDELLLAEVVRACLLVVAKQGADARLDGEGSGGLLPAHVDGSGVMKLYS